MTRCRSCARSAPTPTPLLPTWPTRGPAAALVPAVLGHFGRLRAVVNNASLFEYDDVHSFGHAQMDRHWRSNVAPAVLLAQALHAHLDGAAATGCVVNLLDQKLWNPNPDYLSYTLSKAALEAANTCWPRRWRHACASAASHRA